jgi:hypothetical protein
VRVRLDGGFTAPEIFTFLEREGLEYVVAMRHRNWRAVGQTRPPPGGRINQKTGHSVVYYRLSRKSLLSAEKPCGKDFLAQFGLLFFSISNRFANNVG